MGRGWASAAVVAAVLLATLPAAPASASVQRQDLVFTAVADTWVGATDDDTGGTDTTLQVSGEREAYVRFEVDVPYGLSIAAASLDLTAVADGTGTAEVLDLDDPGEVDEELTWAERPMGGTSLGVLPVAVAGDPLQLDVTGTVPATGGFAVRIRIDDLGTLSVSSREGTTPPTLTLSLSADPAVTTVLPSTCPPEDSTCTGSSAPTARATNRRIAESSGGRRLAVLGRHTSGVVLRWRDIGDATWRDDTAGETLDGTLFPAGTGDWTASITVGVDSAGVEHAWVVAARDTYNSAGVLLVRLSDLDGEDGPTIGEPRVLASPAAGARFADVAFDGSDPDEPRVSVVYSANFASPGDKAVLVGFLSSVDTDAPELVDTFELVRSTTSQRHGTLVPGPDGMHALVRGDSGDTFLWDHTPDASQAWQRRSGVGVLIDGLTAENAVNGAALDDGTIVLVGQQDAHDRTTLIRQVNSDGTVGAGPTMSGYSQAVITSDGTRVWVVALRNSDGAIVSREWVPETTAFVSSDVIEVDAVSSGGVVGAECAPDALLDCPWPSVPRRIGSTLLVITRGPAGADSQQRAVVASSRRVG